MNIKNVFLFVSLFIPLSLWSVSDDIENIIPATATAVVAAPVVMAVGPIAGPVIASASVAPFVGGFVGMSLLAVGGFKLWDMCMGNESSQYPWYYNRHEIDLQIEQLSRQLGHLKQLQEQLQHYKEEYKKNRPDKLLKNKKYRKIPI